MPLNKTAICLLLICAITLSLPSQGQAFRRRHMQEYEPPPKIILVQLTTAYKMAGFYQKKHQSKKATEIRTEAWLAAKAMVKDFKHNFHFCPVYFFYDSNAALIRQGRVADILFSADGSKVNEQVLKAADTNFLIVCYGYAEQEGNMVETKQGLITSGHDQKQKISPFPYRVFPSTDRDSKQFSYVSKKYEVEYMATARELDRTLNKYYDER